MTEQQRLEELSKLKNVSLLSKFIDEATEVICKCDTCQNQFEKFPEVLFEQELWCEQCQQDPTNIVEKMLIESGCNIKEKKFKNMYDFLVVKNNKKFFICISSSDVDYTEQREKAGAMNIKLFMIYKHHIGREIDEIKKFIEDSLLNSEKVSVYISNVEDIKNETKQTEDIIKNDVDDMLKNAGFDRNNLIPIGTNSYSYQTKPILATKDSKIIFGYVRVSTKQQSREGNSIDTQCNTIKGYVASQNANPKAQKLHLRSIFIDFGISGRTVEKRPALVKCLEEMRKNQVLICASLSRLCRNLRQSLKIFDDLKQKGSSLISCDISLDTDSLQGQMMFNMIASFAEMESRQIGERVSAVFRNMKKQGKEIQHRPRYGYKSIKKGQPFERDEREQTMIENIRKLRVQKPDLTVSQLCRELNNLPEDQRGLKDGTKKWYESSLKRLMEYNNIPFSRFDNKEDIIVENNDDIPLYEQT
jgi:DNA invertase Pin-like site-specific DNA recombinase